MHFYSKKINLEKLNKIKLSKFCQNKNRYNIVTDLVFKNKIKNFIMLSNKEFFKKNKNLYIKIFLKVFFCKSKKSKAFPIVELLEINLLDKNKKIKHSAIGIMFSSYIHDLDRKFLESKNFNINKISLILWKSLFQKTIYNNSYFPLKNKNIIMIFPKSNSKSSNANKYMKKLGFKMSYKKINNKRARFFYNKKQNKTITEASLSIGKIILEMIYPNIYGESELQKFDIKKLKSLKEKQNLDFIKWLKYNKLYN